MAQVAFWDEIHISQLIGCINDKTLIFGRNSEGLYDNDCDIDEKEERARRETEEQARLLREQQARIVMETAVAAVDERLQLAMEANSKAPLEKAVAWAKAQAEEKGFSGKKFRLLKQAKRRLKAFEEGTTETQPSRGAEVQASETEAEEQQARGEAVKARHRLEA